MLIVISGCETIKKQTLAAVVNAAMNDVTVTEYPLKNHLKMLFRDILYDYNATQNITYPEGGNYDQFLLDYKDSSYKNTIISGSFSRAFYEMVTRDIEDVKFINIIRNPSVIYFVDSLTLDRSNLYDIPLNVPLLKRRNISSILNSITLKNIPEVSTIRFETVIRDRLLNGIEVPKSYTAFNPFITVEEKLASRHAVVTEADVARFNSVFSDLCNQLMQSDYNLELPATVFEHIPKNVFQELGYTPLTLGHIV